MIGRTFFLFLCFPQTMHLSGCEETFNKHNKKCFLNTSPSLPLSCQSFCPSHHSVLPNACVPVYQMSLIIIREREREKNSWNNRSNIPTERRTGSYSNTGQCESERQSYSLASTSSDLA